MGDSVDSFLWAGQAIASQQPLDYFQRGILRWIKFTAIFPQFAGHRIFPYGTLMARFSRQQKK